MKNILQITVLIATLTGCYSAKDQYIGSYVEKTENNKIIRTLQLNKDSTFVFTRKNGEIESAFLCTGHWMLIAKGRVKLNPFQDCDSTTFYELTNNGPVGGIKVAELCSDTLYIARNILRDKFNFRKMKKTQRTK